MENQEERSELVSWLLGVGLIAVGALLGFLYAGWVTAPEHNAAFAEQMAGNRPASPAEIGAENLRRTELAACQSSLQGAKRTIETGQLVIDSQQSALDAIRETENRWATILYEPDQSGNLVIGAIAMLLGAPTGLASIAQGLSGPKPRWILKGKLQPQSPQENAQYGWLDRREGKAEGPFKAEVLKQ